MKHYNYNVAKQITLNKLMFKRFNLHGGQVHLLVYYIKLKSRLSVCPSVTLFPQLSQHGSTLHLVFIIAKVSGMCKFVFINL